MFVKTAVMWHSTTVPSIKTAIVRAAAIQDKHPKRKTCSEVRLSAISGLPEPVRLLRKKSGCFFWHSILVVICICKVMVTGIKRAQIQVPCCHQCTFNECQCLHGDDGFTFVSRSW